MDKLSVCMEDRLHCLAEILALNGGFLPKHGLARGKLGISIFLYHYARYTCNNYYDELAGSLLDDLIVEINSSAPLDFDEGLTGIGWGITYLINKGFIEGDIDDILEEVDLSISRRLNDFLPSEQINKKRESGYNFYRQARITNSHWDGSEIFSFIKSSDCDILNPDITFLVNPDNYGLFYGIAGKALRILNKVIVGK